MWQISSGVVTALIRGEREYARVLGDNHFLQLAMTQSNEQMPIKISLEEIISSVCKACHLKSDFKGDINQ